MFPFTSTHQFEPHFINNTEAYYNDDCMMSLASEPSGIKFPAEIRRTSSSPHISTILPSTNAASPPSDKRRNKLGYQRTTVACAHCRRRKIRCVIPSPEDHLGRCANCIRLKKECLFQPVEHPNTVDPYLLRKELFQLQQSSSYNYPPTSVNSPVTPATASANVSYLNSQATSPYNLTHSNSLLQPQVPNIIDDTNLADLAPSCINGHAHNPFSIPFTSSSYQIAPPSFDTFSPSSDIAEAPNTYTPSHLPDPQLHHQQSLNNIVTTNAETTWSFLAQSPSAAAYWPSQTATPTSATVPSRSLHQHHHSLASALPASWANVLVSRSLSYSGLHRASSLKGGMQTSQLGQPSQQLQQQQQPEIDMGFSLDNQLLLTQSGSSSKPAPDSEMNSSSGLTSAVASNMSNINMGLDWHQLESLAGTLTMGGIAATRENGDVEST